jgi:ribosome-binding ATPase YchF (GTP1/OBG family)
MSFFNSEIVQEQLQSIYDTYVDLQKAAEAIGEMPKEKAIKHIEKTKNLIEKQKLFYTRLQLSSMEDEDAADMKHRIDLITNMFGYNTLSESLDSMNQYLDNVLRSLDKAD